MQVRITRKTVSVITGESLEECKKRFEAGDNFENDYTEVSVEDTATHKDYTEEWEEL